VTYGCAVVAGLNAAVMSGFVAPAVVNRGDQLFAFTGILNQAFARVLTVASSVAIILWCIAILRTRAFGRAVAIYGLVIGSLIAIVTGLGMLRLNVHGLGAVVILQSAWFVAIGVSLYSRRP
jgi:hypothetical protein